MGRSFYLGEFRHQMRWWQFSIVSEAGHFYSLAMLHQSLKISQSFASSKLWSLAQFCCRLLWEGTTVLWEISTVVPASSGADSRHSGKALMQGTVVIFLLHLSWSASCIWHAKRRQQLEVQWMLFTQSRRQRHSWPCSRTAVAGAHSGSGWSRQAYY